MRAHRVDGGQVAVQQLLGLVRLGTDACPFAQLEDGFLRRRPIPSGTGHEHTIGQACCHLLLQRQLDRAG